MGQAVAIGLRRQPAEGFIAEATDQRRAVRAQPGNPPRQTVRRPHRPARRIAFAGRMPGQVVAHRRSVVLPHPARMRIEALRLRLRPAQRVVLIHACPQERRVPAFVTISYVVIEPPFAVLADVRMLVIIPLDGRRAI